MPKLIRYPIGETHKRILCPGCQGAKIILQPTGVADEQEDLPCDLCKGEGIVEIIVNITYKKIIT